MTTNNMNPQTYCKRPFLLLFLAVVPLLIIGCATTGTSFTPVTHVPPGKALVYVYRLPRFVGAAAYSKIYLNGEFLTDIRNGSYATRAISPGTLVFSSTQRTLSVPVIEGLIVNSRKSKNEQLRIQAQAGKTYYVQWSFSEKPDWNIADVIQPDQMKLMDPSTGAREIAGLHLAPAGGE
jgi:hypothetical protein